MTRRISVRLSARGAGDSPFFSIAAKRNRSIGDFDHAASFTAGGSTFFTGRNDQNSRSFAEVVPAFSSEADRVALGSGQRAPDFTQRVRASISASGIFPLGGIWSESSW